MPNSDGGDFATRERNVARLLRGKGCEGKQAEDGSDFHLMNSRFRLAPGNESQGTAYAMGAFSRRAVIP